MQSGSASPGKAPVPPEDLPAAAAEKEVMADAGGEEVKEDEAKTEAERGGGRPRRRPAAEESESGVVKVKREILAPRITCRLCQRLLREATTISECLHTFCRKCIYKKLTVEELNHCPVCKIDLGCAPVEKLRADHNLQDLRSKLFPVKGKKIIAEVESPVTAPVKIKERSISSLVVDPPRVPTGLTGRRTRAVTRKAAAALRGLGPILDPVGKDNDNTNKHADNISLLDSLSKVPQTRRKEPREPEATPADMPGAPPAPEDILAADTSAAQQKAGDAAAAAKGKASDAAGTSNSAARTPTDAPTGASVSAGQLGTGTPSPSNDPEEVMEGIYGHPRLRSSETEEVGSLPEVFRRAQFSLRQLELAISREWSELEKEHKRLADWEDVLAGRIDSEARKAEEKRVRLEKMEALLKKERVKIGLSDQYSKKIMEEAKAAHERADARLRSLEEAREQLTGRVAAVAKQEQTLAEWEQKLQEESYQLEEKSKELDSHAGNLETREGNLELDRERLGKERAELDQRGLRLFEREVAATSKEGELQRRSITLDSKDKELKDKEKRLAEREAKLAEEIQAAARKAVEDHQAARAAEAREVRDFLGHTDGALVPLGFSPIRAEEPAQTVSALVPALNSARAKLRGLEAVIGEQLEAEGRKLAELVAEHVLTCFRSWDPSISLEPVMQGPVPETEEAATSSVQDVVKAVAARFERQAE